MKYKKYGLGLRGLHWLLAGLLAGIWMTGWWQTTLSPFSSTRAVVSMWHQGGGVLLLVLALIRIPFSFVSGSLPHPGTRAEQKIALVVRGLLLFVPLLVVGTGYWLSASAGRPVNWFGIVLLPELWPLDGAARAVLRRVHQALAWFLAGIVLVHILALIKHAATGRADILRRML